MSEAGGLRKPPWVLSLFLGPSYYRAADFCQTSLARRFSLCLRMWSVPSIGVSLERLLLRCGNWSPQLESNWAGAVNGGSCFLLARKNTRHACYMRRTQQEAAHQEGCRAWVEEGAWCWVWVEGGAWCWVWVMNGRGSLQRQDQPQLLIETLFYLQRLGFTCSAISGPKLTECLWYCFLNYTPHDTCVWRSTSESAVRRVRFYSFSWETLLCAGTFWQVSGFIIPFKRGWKVLDCKSMTNSITFFSHSNVYLQW